MSQEMSPVFVLLAIVGVVSCAMPFGGGAVPSTLPSPKLEVALNSVQMCPDYPDVTTSFDDLAFSMEPESKHTLYIDGVIHIKKEVPPGVAIVFDIRKCYDERDISCEKYLVHEVPDVCSYLNMKGTFWSNFIEHIEGLEPTCPMLVGSYKMVEAPWDLSGFQHGNYTQFAGHWQAEVLYEKGKERFGCALFDVTISITSLI